MSERIPLLGRIPSVLPKVLWRLGVAFTASGIILGAFGTHGMRKRLAPERMHAWETATHYSIFNGLGLLAVSLHPRFSVHRFAGPAIALGGFVFSSSILLLLLGSDKFKKLGPITPMGGSIMIAGCVAMRSCHRD
ncbi:hypothetical protein ACEPAG_150 [Sanghuangporus baumii]